jgi:hypothetical protein
MTMQYMMYLSLRTCRVDQVRQSQTRAFYVSVECAFKLGSWSKVAAEWMSLGTYNSCHLCTYWHCSRARSAAVNDSRWSSARAAFLQPIKWRLAGSEGMP